MQRRLGQQMRAHRRGDEQKQRNQHFMQADVFRIRAEIDGRCDQQAADAQRRCLGGTMQARVQILEPDESERADKSEQRAGQN